MMQPKLFRSKGWKFQNPIEVLKESWARMRCEYVIMLPKNSALIKNLYKFIDVAIEKNKYEFESPSILAVELQVLATQILEQANPKRDGKKKKGKS